MQKIRIRDIAEIANVSVGTVDRVIHERGGVSESTRERIQKLLEQHHYTPDPIASSLALKRQLRLWVVMPGSVNDHAFWSLPGSGIRRAMEELSGYRISIETFCFDQFSKSDFRNRIGKFPYELVNGVLFAPVFRKESVQFINQCSERGIPVVLFNSFIENTGARGFVGQDAFRSGYVAAKLIGYGLEHRRDVAIVNMAARKDHYAHIIDREKGFRAYFEDHSGHLDHLVTVDLNGEAEERMKEDLDEIFRNFHIGGLFVTNSRVSKVAAYLAARGSMSVRLLGYDLLPENIFYLKRDYIDFLISQKPEEQAYRGLLSLFHLVAFNRQPEERQLMPIDIITRENLEYYKR